MFAQNINSFSLSLSWPEINLFQQILNETNFCLLMIFIAIFQQLILNGNIIITKNIMLAENNQQSIKFVCSTYRIFIEANQAQKHAKIQLWDLRGKIRRFSRLYYQQTLQVDTKKAVQDIPELIKCFRQYCCPNLAKQRIETKYKLKFKDKEFVKQLIIKLQQDEVDVQKLTHQYLSKIKYDIQKLKQQEKKIVLQKQIEVGMFAEEEQKCSYERPKPTFWNKSEMLLSDVDFSIRKIYQMIKVHDIETKKLGRQIKNIVDIQLLHIESNQEDEIFEENQQKIQHINIQSNSEGMLSIFQQQIFNQKQQVPEKEVKVKVNQEENIKKNHLIKPSSNIKYKNLELKKKRPNSYNNFKLNGNIIKYQKIQQKLNQLVINYRLKYYFVISSFRVKIIYTKFGDIRIGVIDAGNTNTQITKVAATYHGATGSINQWVNTQKIGHGFKTSDIIEVQLESGLIKWFVNGNLQAKHAENKLYDNRTFYPFIEMNTSGDMIQWMPQ